MQLLVELQEPFTYSFILVIILIFIIGVSIGIYIYHDKIEEFIYSKTISFLKKRYSNKLDNLLNDVNNKTIDNRGAYQNLSKIARQFIKNATHIDVSTISLDEAKKLNIPGLSKLMEECYPPEFSKNEQGRIVASINNTRRIIDEWQ